MWRGKFAKFYWYAACSPDYLKFAGDRKILRLNRRKEGGNKRIVKGVQY
jgi:hypothetical protein